MAAPKPKTSSRPSSRKAGTEPNPLLARWTTPFAIAPFGRIVPDHFRPAFDEAIARHEAEIDRICAAKSRPTFKNTIVALEDSGRLLDRVSSTFWNLTGAHTNDALQAIEREMAPRLAKHYAAITSNAELFARVDAIHSARDRLPLDQEQRRVLERTHLGFVRSGARLKGQAKKRMAEIIERLATLGTSFSQNVLADEKAYVLELARPHDIAGLPDFVVAAAAAAASERSSKAGHIVTLSRSLIEPFLTFSARRDLREKAWKAWVARGLSGRSTDNRAIVAEILELRQERARLLGYDTFAAYKLEDSMAKTPERVRNLLEAVWGPARLQAAQESKALAACAARDGQNTQLEPWDWRYYSEKVRKEQFDLDEAEIKPYLPLTRMIEAAFDTAGRLFGLKFKERSDITLYHPDARAWEVTTKAGTPVGLFIGDYFARSSKRSGAWMSSFRSQERLKRDVRPVIVNVMNFAKAGDGAETLLSFDDARTLFHEFGHGLHGLLSDVTFPSLSGTSVARDFVELPSQLYEHWLSTDEVLSRFARHVETGKAMPPALIKKLKRARNFNQGFATVEYLGSALVDLEFHSGAWKGEDPLGFEAAVLARIGMPREIGMRHRTPHFAHVFSGDGYSAGYYSYMWSEVLDADAFAAFEEAGSVFDAPTARRLKTYVYAAGGMREEEAAYTAFRGRLPTVDGLLRKRGLATPATRS